MCIALPAKILERAPGSDLAKADVVGTLRDINVGLIDGEGIAPGDWVLVHSGFAISKVDQEEAKSTIEFYQSWQ